MRNPIMQFVLKGFSQVREFRVFAFDAVAPDWTRTAYTVRTNLDLTRRYGIPLQELPLLCRAVLERLTGAGPLREFTFTEEDMRLRAAARAAAVVRKKSGRPPVVLAADSGQEETPARPRFSFGRTFGDRSSG